MMVQRWRISSNSQPADIQSADDHRCLWWFKDEEFQAIHNSTFLRVGEETGVYDGSKMKNFKQFTTGWKPISHAPQVFMMVQRWRISSNSQRGRHPELGGRWCLWWFKDEEFQAIHNLKFLIPNKSKNLWLKGWIPFGHKVKKNYPKTRRKLWKIKRNNGILSTNHYIHPISMPSSSVTKWRICPSYL